LSNPDLYFPQFFGEVKSVTVKLCGFDHAVLHKRHNWRIRRKFLKRGRNDPKEEGQPSLSSLVTRALFQNVTL